MKNRVLGFAVKAATAAMAGMASAARSFFGEKVTGAQDEATLRFEGTSRNSGRHHTNAQAQRAALKRRRQVAHKVHARAHGHA